MKIDLCRIDLEAAKDALVACAEHNEIYANKIVREGRPIFLAENAMRIAIHQRQVANAIRDALMHEPA